MPLIPRQGNEKEKGTGESGTFLYFVLIFSITNT
ncbi:hypothetical protein DET59_10972 [Rossellomorea aquimaris]|uniref:Uncharacterized protein n=1 Tax=Rossellomorea aquimaris TaxID=189382 RepID=A0A366ENX3_9BACI|nr:hypothetical protein DET59_10972 [Rossellomorea aquimaris]